MSESKVLKSGHMTAEHPKLQNKTIDMNLFLSELIGTAFLILLGNGVVANVVLDKTKGNSSGWTVITFGWAMAVFTGVFIAAKGSGAHLNPAVSVAMAMLGRIGWVTVPQYIAAQMLGAMIGQLVVWLTYKDHYGQHTDHEAVRATFCTSPAIRKPVSNLITEAVGTCVLVLGVLFMSSPAATLGTLDALPVALLVLAIGLSLGGPTGYAINPARDLGPRIVHFILPLRHKGHSDWSYAWVPVAGPLAGAVMAVLIFNGIAD